MFETIYIILATGQAQEASANPIVEYALYAGFGALILGFVASALRKPKNPQPVSRDQPEPELPKHRTKAELEEEARRTFRIPQVLTEEGADAMVRMSAPQKVELPPEPEAPPEPEVPPEAAPEPATPKAPGIEQAGRTLREGLSRTNAGFVKKLGKIFGSAKTIDDDVLGELEEALFTADIGVRTSQALVDLVYDGLNKRQLKDPAKIWEELKANVANMLQVDADPLDLDRADPFVIMVVGVNGAGKTTTIGKLAAKWSAEGRKVMLAAGDTFRAAAVEQLEVWAERAGVPVVKGTEGQDPSSVIFEAARKAKEEGYQVCIADTAGRLQAKKELMDELAKVHRVMGKAVPGAPHEVWLVLDSTNGQNAISQAKEFTQVVDVTGLALTKLDGTAKGGVVIGICDELKVPVRFIGIGEQVEDLREFEPRPFAEALFAED